MALVALQHVGSSWIRGQTRVPCTSRQIFFFFFFFLPLSHQGNPYTLFYTLLFIFWKAFFFNVDHLESLY